MIVRYWAFVYPCKDILTVYIYRYRRECGCSIFAYIITLFLVQKAVADVFITWTKLLVQYSQIALESITYTNLSYKIMSPWWHQIDT